MIMWRNRFIVALIAGFLAISVPSCGPDLGELDLSGCVASCSDSASICMAEANAAIEGCAVDDVACQHEGLVALESCFTSGLDCLAICVAAAEDLLKQ